MPQQCITKCTRCAFGLPALLCVHCVAGVRVLLHVELCSQTVHGYPVQARPKAQCIQSQDIIKKLSVALGLHGMQVTARGAICAKLVAEVMEQPAYDELRTRQQLGYSVQTLYTEHAGTSHACIS